MKFKDKVGIAIGNTRYYDGSYSKPITCPFCGVATDCPIRQHNSQPYEESSLKKQFVTLSIPCNSCEKTFIAMYIREMLDGKAVLSFVRCHPHAQSMVAPEELRKLSPRFAAFHDQSQAAESNDLLDLAATGYRSALEMLIKDYAIQVLDKEQSVVAKKDLFGAIGEYLKQEDLVKTSDVVRILGNDFTHYQRKYPNHDFETLKYYYEIFLGLVRVQYAIHNPPVARQ